MSDAQQPPAPQPAPPTEPAQPVQAVPVYQQQQYAYPPSRPTNTFAIVSFVLGFVISLGAVIFGHIALNQIKRTGEGGRGFAIAGLVLGYVGIGVTVLVVAVYVVVIVFALIAAGGVASQSGYSAT